MTREEFRDYVEFLRSQDEISYDVYSGLVDGIDTLELESCEDAISRAEALKAINKMDIPEDMCVFEIKSHIGVEIGTLPPVYPKSKTGHWIPLEYDAYADGNPVWNKWECSECGHEEHGESDMLTCFCPYCGAEMLESESEE